MQGPDPFAQRERVATDIFETADAACVCVADAIEATLRERAAAGRAAVLGLATGSTPVRLYRELIRRHREEGLSFANAVTFNLDEYHGLGEGHPESYRRFMREQLFEHIDIPPENTHVPDGTVAREAAPEACRAYEAAIAEAGGIDIQILGIGRTGHIGFNEPGSGADSRTRLVTLDPLTRRDAARDFLGEANVPRHAITMGVGTILEAGRVFLLAWGEAKAPVIARTVEGERSEAVPATFLQQHPDCRFCIDRAAASRLTRMDHPWLVGPVEWTEATTRKAVLWLARKTEKSILKLVDEDYAENGMADLLTRFGQAYDANLHLFNVTQHTITGWPGGKPGADDHNRPERAAPFPKRSLVLGPEPLDEVAGMGGTLSRLHAQGHELTAAYQTSGNLAVPDEDARGAIELMIELSDSGRGAADRDFVREVETQLDQKGTFGEDTAEIRFVKGLIRRGEARASARTLGVGPDRLRFLDLPFYETGRYRRFALGEADIAATHALLESVRPHQIFLTGAGNEPLSVPALCFEVFRLAFARCAGSEWLRDCRVWLYRSGGREWETHQIDMAVPLSPGELGTKIQGIYQHQSQRRQSAGDEAKGAHDTWDRARRLNRTTAEIYDALGLAEYEAIECFQRWSPEG